MADHKITQAEIDAFYKKTRRMSNNGQFKQVYALAKRYNERHPHVFLFAYMEAVYTAEDTTGLPKHDADRLYKEAARKLKKLFPRFRTATPRQRYSTRNEYYWFSKQPYKQYRLGVEKGRKGYYSAGVGAARLARKYAREGRRGLCLKWARIAEKAWLNFFARIDANWFNSYMFYAEALAYQGRMDEMERALERGARIAGKTKNWRPFRELRVDIAETLRRLEQGK